jgi:hypothetical protein
LTPLFIVLTVLLFLPREQERARLRASRKKLEAVCKSERRRVVEFSLQQGIAVTDETKSIDEEPQLGERHKGVWDLFGQVR